MQLLCLLHVLSLDFFVSKFLDHEIGELTNLQPFTSLSEASPQVFAARRAGRERSDRKAGEPKIQG